MTGRAASRALPLPVGQSCQPNNQSMLGPGNQANGRYPVLRAAHTSSQRVASQAAPTSSQTVLATDLFILGLG